MVMVQRQKLANHNLNFSIANNQQIKGYSKSSICGKGRELKLCEMNENDFLECFNSRKRGMLLNNDAENGAAAAAANSNNTVSDLTRNNYNRKIMMS